METVLFHNGRSGTDVVYILDDGKAKDFIKACVKKFVSNREFDDAYVLNEDMFEDHNFDWIYGQVRLDVGGNEYEAYTWKAIAYSDRRKEW